MKASIRTKIFMAIIIQMICITSLSVVSIDRLFYFLNEYNEQDQAYYLINSLRIQNDKNEELIRHYMSTGDMVELSEFNIGVDKFYSILNTLEDELDSLSSYFIIRSIRNGSESYSYECNQAIILQRDGDSKYHTHIGNSNRIHDYIDGYIEQLLQSSLDENVVFYNELIHKADEVKTAIFTAFVVMFVFGLIAAYFFSNYITKYQMEAKIKDARFLALHSQINPHFLFNTLNSVSRTAMFEGAVKTRELVQSLSKLLRYSLDNHSEGIPLRREIENVTQYLMIQKVRFGDRIDYRINTADPKLGNTVIPPFVLQPLVENSIIHGLEPKVDGGFVDIHIDACDGHTRIQISDNGLGMDYERLDEVLKGKDDQRQSIGILNVKERLEIFTKSKNAMMIDSSTGEGTTITILL